MEQASAKTRANTTTMYTLSTVVMAADRAWSTSFVQALRFGECLPHRALVGMSEDSPCQSNAATWRSRHQSTPRLESRPAPVAERVGAGEAIDSEAGVPA